MLIFIFYLNLIANYIFEIMLIFYFSLNLMLTVIERYFKRTTQFSIEEQNVNEACQDSVAQSNWRSIVE